MAGSHERSLRVAIREAHRASETACLRERLQQARLGPDRERLIQNRARQLAAHARDRARHQTGLEAFLQEYDLSSPEGVLLMCIAEALLRIPDTQTADRLIRDRLSRGQWDDHLGASSSLLVNASSWGLLLTGSLFTLPDTTAHAGPEQFLKRLVARAGEPVVRLALQRSMQMLAQQFVLGQSIQEAVQRAGRQSPGQRYSYDCLGEAAHSAEDVARYLETYREAIHYIGDTTRPDSTLTEQAGISVKLSALHPRYEYSQRERVLRELLPRVQLLIEDAVAAGISLTLDAEEADRLELSLDLFERLVSELREGSWQGLGLAVQAYQKRAWPVLQWLHYLAQKVKRRFPVRLVKGAYWDTEIKRAQEAGLDSYPVFTRKSATDVSYLACAGFLMRNTDLFYPQMASHNALTLTWVHELGKGQEYELQRLHGMADSLYQALPEYFDDMPPVRIYAPVGSHEELLPYLVRRLLENGANSSFVNQLTDEGTALAELVENPCDHIEEVGCQPHPDIPLPAALYGDERRNARGWDFPLAIFVGQVAAALAAGNTVLAKPARQTPLTGYQAIRLMYEAGVPTEVLHFLPGSGTEIGRLLCADQRLGGVAFTGSTDTAWNIQRALADRRGPFVPLIAETGGQNVMIADSSALPEQLVVDVLQSAFNSAGQRCSALRVLFVQEEIAEVVIRQLTAAMEEISIGDPVSLATDVGPLIDQAAIQGLLPHVDYLRREARFLQSVEPGPHLAPGCFFPLYAFELESLDLLDKEEFGPILHVIRYQGNRLDKVIEAVNATGYGLTLGVHSRVEATWQQVRASARVGNLYVNRNMIGAVVGAQPFGGEGLSGTGPKAGGPYYLHRFALERTLSVNTAAMGGNIGLLSMRED